MNISVGRSQKLFPYGNYAPIQIDIIIEDKVMAGETKENAYDRINELQKYLYCKKVVESLSKSDIDPYLEKNRLLDRAIELLENIDIELLNRNS